MSDAQVKYNNKRVPVSGTGPTPYVSLNQEVINYGDRWGIQNKITLNGVITGQTFNDLYFAQTGLVDLFSSSYQLLEVNEAPDDSTAFSEAYLFSGCAVDRISFDQARYSKVVGYSVELSSYPSGLSGFFSGTFGVLDPKDEIKITEGTDGFCVVSHTVSARGFVTTSIDAALNNAKNYVASRTGAALVLATPVISGVENSGAFTPVLVSLAEDIDRLNLAYSVEETYRFKMFTGDTEASNGFSFNNYYLTSYTTSISSGVAEDVVTASIRGEIKAGITGATGDVLASGLIAQLSGLNPYGIISGKYGSPNGYKFCNDPIQFTIEEDLKSRAIKFDASYDNLEFYNSSNDKYAYGGCFFDATIIHTIDPLTNVDTINIRGDIKARGSIQNRYANTLLYLGQLMTAGSSASFPRIYDFANDYYSSYYTSSKYALSAVPISLSVNGDPFMGTISIDCVFDNKDRFSSLSNSDFSIEYTPSNTIYAYASSCNQNAKHLAVDINVKRREKVALNLSLAGQSSTEKNLLDAKDTIFAAFVSSFINGLIQDQASLQVEDSAIALTNSTATTPISTTIGTDINATRTYSYELLESERPNRPVIKSRS